MAVLLRSEGSGVRSLLILEGDNRACPGFTDDMASLLALFTDIVYWSKLSLLMGPRY